MCIFRRFAGDTRGNVAIIVGFLLLPILVLAGGATDMARYEAHRAQLQDGVDRGVLAAASLSQSSTVENTVKDYLKPLPFYSQVGLRFDYTTSINQRRISVTADYQMPAGFLPLVGISTLPITVAATAQERRTNVEISLVLDVSGSMRQGSPVKMGLLRPAAKQFIDLMLSPDNVATTSISIVPYAGTVNPGAMAFDGLGVPKRHNHSTCMEFQTGDYAVGLIPFNQRTQVPHFTQNHANVNETGLDWGWCPSEPSAIRYITNDAAGLKNKIDTMRMADGTGSAIGLKWGMLLLEPAAQPYVSMAAGAGMVPAQYSNRPAQFNDPNTIKVIVLMTDGEISDQPRPRQYDYPRNPEGSGGNTNWYNATTAATHLQSVCDRAKNNGVIVFTIGFQVPNNAAAQNQMRNCASSPSHYYNVAGLDIAGAFKNIATSIQRVKLTQ